MSAEIATVVGEKVVDGLWKRGTKYCIKNKRKIITGFKKIIKPNQEDYDFISADMDITIYNTQLGIGISTRKVRVNKDNPADLQHTYDICDCGYEGLVLDKLSCLNDRIKKNVHCRFKKQTLACKLISKNGVDVDFDKRILGLKLDEKRGGDEQYFFSIRVDDKNFEKGEEIIYKYAFTLPNMYPAKKEFVEHDQKGKKRVYKTLKIGETECYHHVFRATEKYDEIKFSVSFEEGINISGKVELYRSDDEKLKKNKKLIEELKKEEDIYYTRYVSKSIKGIIRDKYYVLVWRLS